MRLAEKEIKCEACGAFYLFFAKSLVKSIIQEHECKILSYVIKITLKFHFCCKNVIILSLCMQPCFGHHNLS